MTARWTAGVGDPVLAAIATEQAAIAAEVTRADGKYVATAGLDAATAPLVTGNGTTAASLRAAYGPHVAEAAHFGVPVSGSNFAVPTPNVTQTATYRWRYWTYIACANLRARFDNFGSSASTPYADLDGTAAITITASVIVGNTTAYRLTFGGATSVTIQPGASAWHDPLGLELDTGSQLDYIVYVNGTSYYTNHISPGSGGVGGSVIGATDLTPTGSGVAATPTTVVPDANVVIYGPSVVMGIPSGGAYLRYLLGSGDSITAGVGDTAGNYGSTGSGAAAWTPSGWLERAAKLIGVGLLNLSKTSDQVINRVTTGPSTHFRRMALVRPGQIAVCELGINDMSQTATQAAIQAAMVTHWRMFTRRGCKAVQSTITPSSTSTDSWATTVNQTPTTTNSSNTKRVAINGWLRAGAPLDNATSLTPVAVGTGGALLAGQAGHPLTTVIEVADTVESARDSGVWKAPGYTTDGLHPTVTAHAAIAAAVQPQLQPLLSS